MYAKSLLCAAVSILCCLLFLPAFAQNRTITGKVTDGKDGSTLPGVSVTVKGTSVGTVTQVDGSFRLSVPPGSSTLVVSSVGYERQEINLGSRTAVNVSLKGTTGNLSDVVVIGYGTQRVKDATGSVASLGPKNFNKGVISSPEQLLQGRVSGVQVTPASGEPGAGVSINIRGASSVRSGNNPLYVVDGVPLDNGGTSGGLDAGAGTSSARNPLSFLNPADIENISVLKDASAAAIYGSRGANGVILITTRKGSKGQGIQFTANTSVSSPAKKYDLMNAADYVKYATAAGADPAVIDKKGNTDWQDVIFRTAVSQGYNLGYGDAGKSTTYRFNFGYDNQQGIVENSSLKRLTGRLNASQNLFGDRVRIDLNFTASNVKNRYAPISDNAGFEGSLIGAALLSNPTYPIKNPDGSYFNNSDANFRNAANMLEYINDRDNLNRYLTNLSGTWKVIKNLSYKVNFGYDNNTAKRETFMDARLIGYTGSQSIRNSPSIPQVTGNGRGIEQNLKLRSTIIEHTLTYDKKFGSHALNLLGGYSYQQFKNYSFNNLAYGQKDKTAQASSLDDFNTRPFAAFGDSSKYELQSYFGRANYTYKDKYFLTFTFRTDGSSKFGANNKYGYFPAGAFKWRVSDESWAPKKVFDDLSLRLNYGLTGNQEFPPYASLAVSQYQLNGSTTIISNASPTLKWETKTQYGVGLDFTIAGGRLSGTVDYFHNSLKNVLFLQVYAQPSASTQRWVNLPGNVINKGVDYSLNFQAIKGRKFNWEIAYNGTYTQNTIKNFGNRVIITGDINGQGLSGAYSQVIRDGYPLGSFYLPTWTGYDANGISTYANDGLSSIVGSALPKFTQGLTNNFTYGRWNASLFINASTGFVIYNNTANAYFLKGSLKNGRNVSYDAATSNENPLNSGSVSTRFLEKGDFVRISNANIGYTFPTGSVKGIRTLRLSVTGQNLALITGYKGLDPEVNTNKSRDNVPSRGIDYTAYPNARTFTLGINAGF
ncbi:SusC/RagA family TonB-linked outer membrane protein [Mucilaginibacter sp. Bleaf8]|uniref:SusC/RagA family TonB-linked outer membrane protein n=1 Tax=Mucilaginibacter sp. Bleaf8 TaxID=2834430 RepID=UPI001BCBA3E4|nr:SusC/RagA family TonB-linked outer membrane protein [Mucilaginibacter sp. Bleaf8]MBS7563001.1 SusC/RagA family TonB-linked outer membrane protein [Mucilaginibacter sp. Bleaf8]